MRPIVFLSALMAHALPAALIVNDEQTITHQVRVQPIVVSDSDGTNTAVFMGSQSTEDYIKGQVYRAWAQVGIQIIWEDEVPYWDDFTNSGNHGSGTRPSADLYAIVRDDDDAPKSSSETTINMFFVNSCPAFAQLSEYQVAGYARIDRNGTCVTIGSSLVLPLNWSDGPDSAKDSIAAVLAHEIGHCLGLSHTLSLADNLMYSGGGDLDPEYLISEQRGTVLTDNTGIDGFDFAASLSVDPPPVDPNTNYGAWVLANEVVGGVDDDDDGDRLSNGLEFFYNLPPKVASSLPPPTESPQGLMWSLVANQDAIADGFTWFAETSTDLSNWLPAGGDGGRSVRVLDFSNFNKIQFALAPNQPGVFLRFGVTPPESLLGASSQSRSRSTSSTLRVADDSHEHCSSGCCRPKTVPLATE
ncbi:hypothetical protein [Haloferula rosea]|uniref:Matrixin n=1 Tax=Haloferula rosea TaxID=490093 RepID=A0A934RD75_9BACT|nr:hypothetical protein [Haloferula rosea]MBK1826431.1 hypothetical protein [Haloferula rosea]